MFILVCIGALISILLIVIYLLLDKRTSYQSLKDKHIVITGGSSGIGKAAALESCKRGANVTIIGRDLVKLIATVQELSRHCKESGQKIQHAVFDVTSGYQEVSSLFSNLENNFGPIFMLINCAGSCKCGRFEDMTEKEIKYMVDLNYFGSAYPIKYVLPGMKTRNEGIIVLVSTEAALLGIYGYSAYAASKWAVRGLAETILMELVGTGVQLTLSFPPDTDTPGFHQEELTKPEETKLISGSGGLHSSEEIGRQLVEDALAGKTYSAYGLSGKVLTLLFCGSIESGAQILLQFFTMGVLRLVSVGIILSFHSIVRNGLKKRKNESSKNK